MPRGEHPNSKANLKKGRKFNAETARINGEKGRTVQTEIKSISEELKEMLGDTDEKGNTRRKMMAAIALKNAKDSPKWFELILKLAGEMPADVQVVNLNTPNSEDVDRMLEELKAHAKK